jgi:hypothetical protein
MTDAIDGRALRARWDAASDHGAAVLGRQRALAEERGDRHVAWYLGTALAHLVQLRNSVDARRSRPGSKAPGLMHDAPEDLWHEPYTESGRTLEELTALWQDGLGASGWDWSKGFPPGWPTSLRDRLRALGPVRTR